MRNLAEMSSAAATAALSRDSVIVLPTGAIEHHGPHLPLATDHLVAEAVAIAAVDEAAAAGVDVWRLPGLAYTKSDEHHWASGTVWLRWETMMATLVDIGRSVATTPARRLAFLNGHGGMSALLQVASREIRRQFGLQTFVLHAAVPPDQGGPSATGELGLGVHGGLAETSLILHLRPELVDMSTAVRSVPEHLTRYQHVGFGKSVSFGWLSDDFGPSGVIGDPTGATAELGADLFGSAVSHCSAALAEIAVFDPAGP
ncbi:creatinine amidohydrolase [Nakamurella sp. UYEF19]|uniref:creatininase family protein n=1 Tax=Nakamurella sp. UYEF19 TaxID=1756392 RepID=UPI00339AE6FA